MNTLQKIADDIAAGKTNFTKEAEKLGISDNGLRKRMKSAGVMVPKIDHSGRYKKTCVYCKKVQMVEYNRLKDYKNGGMLKNTYCSKDCQSADAKRRWNENGNTVWNGIKKSQ